MHRSYPNKSSLNTSWKVVTYSMIQRVYSDYDFIVLIFVCFSFYKDLVLISR